MNPLDLAECCILDNEEDNLSNSDINGAEDDQRKIKMMKHHCM